jgi:hypothetical protein
MDRSNPFPGMNPYLEREWSDVHPSLLIYAKAQLQRSLPAALKARVEQEVVVDETTPWPDAIPDIAIWQSGEGVGTAVLEAPVVTATPIRLEVPRKMQRHLAIRDRRGRLITVVEVISPSNKRGRGSKEYETKRGMFMGSGVSIVEIDLIRRGGSVVALFDAPDLVAKAGPLAACPYMVNVIRGSDLRANELYPVRLQERLPIIRVPLRDEDPDCPLDVQAMIDQCYVEGGYWDLNYNIDPDPPLEGEDATWADAFLRSKNLRATS